MTLIGSGGPQRTPEEFLAFVLSNTPIIVWTTDAQGILTSRVGRLIESLGIPHGHGRGHHITEIFADAPEVVQAHRRALDGEEVSAVLHLHGLTFRCHISPVRERGSSAQAGVEGVVGVAMDITTQHQDAAGLRLRNRMLSAIYAVDRATAETLDLGRVLDDGLKAALAALQAEGGVIFLLSEDGQNLLLRSHAGHDPALVEMLSTRPATQGISGKALAERRPQIMSINQYENNPVRPYLVQAGYQTLASAPLLTTTGPVGALSVVTTTPNAFPGPEVELLASLGLQLGAAVQRAQFHETVQRKTKELTALNAMFQQYLKERDEAIGFLQEQGERQRQLLAEFQAATRLFEETLRRQFETFAAISPSR